MGQPGINCSSHSHALLEEGMCCVFESHTPGEVAGCCPLLQKGITHQWALNMTSKVNGEESEGLPGKGPEGEAHNGLG